MITDKLASIQTPRKVDRRPAVDIRSTTEHRLGVLRTFGLAGWSNTPRVQVQLPGSLPVVEIIPTTKASILVEGIGITPGRSSTRSGDPRANAIDPAHSMNQLLIYGDGTPTIPGHERPAERRLRPQDGESIRRRGNHAVRTSR